MHNKKWLHEWTLSGLAILKAQFPSRSFALYCITMQGKRSKTLYFPGVNLHSQFIMFPTVGSETPRLRPVSSPKVERLFEPEWHCRLY